MRFLCANTWRLWLALWCLAATGCREVYLLHRELRPATELHNLDTPSPYLKAHLANGGLLVFDRWTVDGAAGRLTGQAWRFDAARRQIGSGPVSVPMDSVLLAETNLLERSPGLARLRTLATFSVVAGAAQAAALAGAPFQGMNPSLGSGTW